VADRPTTASSVTVELDNASAPRHPDSPVSVAEGTGWRRHTAGGGRHSDADRDYIETFADACSRRGWWGWSAPWAAWC